MNATFTVTFKGFHEKLAATVEKMLRDDIAAYPDRMSMDSASVTPGARVVKSAPRHGSVALAKVKEVVEKVKSHAKS